MFEFLSKISIIVGPIATIVGVIATIVQIVAQLRSDYDWLCEDSIVRIASPTLWRRNVVFNALRLDYVNAGRLDFRISRKETPLWVPLALLLVSSANLWALYALSGNATAQSSTQQPEHVATAPSSGTGFTFSSIWVIISFILSLLMIIVFACYLLLLHEEEDGRRIRVLSLYLRDLGLSRDASRVAAKYWYHFAIEHPPTQIFTEDEVGDFVSLRLQHCYDSHLLMRRNHVDAIRDGRNKVKCPTCGKKVWSWRYEPRWRPKFNGEWNEKDIKLAFAALSDLFRKENVENYLRRHESRLGHGGLEGAGGDDGAAGNRWFSRALRRKRKRRQPRS